MNNGKYYFHCQIKRGFQSSEENEKERERECVCVRVALRRVRMCESVCFIETREREREKAKQIKRPNKKGKNKIVKIFLSLFSFNLI